MNDLQAPPTCKDRLKQIISENADQMCLLTKILN